jgi:hypothetical protein
MKQRLLVPSLALVGIFLLGIGLAWDHLVSSSAYWNEAQAEEYNAAQFDLHAKSHHHENPSEAHKQEFDAAKKRFEHISARLNRARNYRNYTATALEALGVLAVLVACVIHFRNRAPA